MIGKFEGGKNIFMFSLMMSCLAISMCKIKVQKNLSDAHTYFQKCDTSNSQGFGWWKFLSFEDLPNECLSLAVYEIRLVIPQHELFL